MFSKLLWSLILLLFLQFPSFAQDITLPFQPVKDRPYFESPEVMIDSAEYNTLILRIKSAGSGTARLFWASSYDMQFNPPKSLWFYIKRGERSYYFNVPSQNPYWMGWIRKFIIYPETGTQNIQVRSANVIRGNLFTNLASAWQEFWGPKGRVVIGSTINLIPSSLIFGRSINIYIYWIIGLFCAVFFGIKFIQGMGKIKDPLNALNFSISETVRQTLILAIGLWTLLALNSDYNFFNIFKENYSKYFGKSIEQKRAIAYGKDYYNFLVFAKEKLPREPVEFGVVSSMFADHLHARIYLVPHVYTDNEEKDFPFLLVFKPAPEQLRVIKNYMLFAKRNENEYILKRKVK